MSSPQVCPWASTSPLRIRIWRRGAFPSLTGDGRRVLSGDFVVPSPCTLATVTRWVCLALNRGRGTVSLIPCTARSINRGSVAPLRTDGVALVEGPGFLQGLSGLVGHSLARRERKAGQGEDLPCREGEHAAATAGKERALKLRSSETTDGHGGHPFRWSSGNQPPSSSPSPPGTSVPLPGRQAGAMGEETGWKASPPVP